MHKFCNILTIFEPFSLGLNFLSGAVHDEDETAFTKGELEEALKEADRCMYVEKDKYHKMTGGVVL